MGELLLLPFLLTLTLDIGIPLGSVPVSSSGVSINTEMESKCFIEKARHRNSCCFVNFRASCVPVPEEERLLKEVNTQCLHCQGCFCPKARATFRQKRTISQAWSLLWEGAVAEPVICKLLCWHRNREEIKLFDMESSSTANADPSTSALGRFLLKPRNPGWLEGRSFLISWVLWQYSSVSKISSHL